MRKSVILLVSSLALVLPLLFMGCEGDDGAQGPPGPQGLPGPPGVAGGPGPALQSNETCFLCHSAGRPFDVNAMHRLNPTTGNPLSPGSATITVTSVVFGAPVGDNVPVTVNFTFAATDSAGNNVTSQIDLRTIGAAANDNLAFMRFLLAKFVPGTNGDADEWNVFVVNPGASGSGPYGANRPHGVDGAVFTGTPATGVYSYTFPTSAVRVSDGYDNTALMRAGVQFSVGNPNAVNTPVLNAFTTDPYYQSFPRANRRRPAANAWLDVVPPAGGVGTGVVPAPGAFPSKKDVSTAACNTCHDPLAIHGGGRREYQFCQICHNAKLETPAGGGWDNTNLVNLVHKIHGEHEGVKLDLGPAWVEPNGQIFGAEVTYPQDIRNCTKCHQGPAAADNTYANWQLKPTRTACGSCHINVNFATGAGHSAANIVQTNNSGCATCHPPAAIVSAHATENATPNNPQLPGTLVSFEYGIDNVTVDDNNVATIKFWIKKNGAFVDLGTGAITRPAGFSGGPSFLFAYALPQDGVAQPADYNNLGRPFGQPESLSIIGLPIVDNVGTSQYTVQRANAFPVDAQMRAVALQGYFTQTNGADVDGDGALDNVGRHTFSVVRAVTGDRVRRVAVESGYTNNNNPITGTPVGCLECHEIFEGHGGNRVSNAQVCVMCHNPSLTSSARTFTTTPTTPDVNNNGVSDIVDLYGTNPLNYPEVANNFKELIHGLHGALKRTTNFVDIRNRAGGVLVTSDEITFPGEPSHCGKCHLNNLYQEIQTTNRLLTTAQITTGADNTVADVTAARNSMPNATDLVNTPATSACGHCHDSDPARSHFIAMGGSIREPRGVADVTVPPLSLEFGGP